MRPAARILLVEAEALPPLLATVPVAHFDRPTVCDGWSVRDVLAHCGAALTHVAAGTVHTFAPADNERDVAARRSWELSAVIAELLRGYDEAAQVIDTAGRMLDGVGLGEWIHGGDVREALGLEDPYASPGIDLAVPLLVERSHSQAKPALAVTIDDQEYEFGSGTTQGELATDAATFVRLCGDRRPDPARYRLRGVEQRELVLFS